MNNTQSYIMTDEGSVLVKVIKSLSNYCHLLCKYHINTLVIKVRTYILGILTFFN